MITYTFQLLLSNRPSCACALLHFAQALSQMHCQFNCGTLLFGMTTFTFKIFLQNQKYKQHLKLFNHRTLLYQPPKVPKKKDIYRYITAWMCLQAALSYGNESSKIGELTSCVFCLTFGHCIILGALEISFPCGLCAQVHRLDGESSRLILMGRTKKAYLCCRATLWLVSPSTGW